MAEENSGAKRPHPGTANLRPWKPGQSGNPSGRPKNRVSIVEQLRRTVGRRPEVAQALVEAWISRALTEGGTKDLAMILDRLDGAVVKHAVIQATEHRKVLGFADPLAGDLPPSARDLLDSLEGAEERAVEVLEGEEEDDDDSGGQ